MTTASDTAKYEMHHNPAYQIDWKNSASGKRVSATKRRVCWRFGFSNSQAISDGQTGMNCRGEEHEVVLTWSLTSGKRYVIVDGTEVHFSMGKRSDTSFSTSWTMSGHILKVVANAAPPLFASTEFRQFDLFLDGCSFFDLPRIFELGIINTLQRFKGMSQRNSTNMSAERRKDSDEDNNHRLPAVERTVRFQLQEHSPQRIEEDTFDFAERKVPDRSCLVTMSSMPDILSGPAPTGHESPSTVFDEKGSTRSAPSAFAGDLFVQSNADHMTNVHRPPSVDTAFPVVATEQQSYIQGYPHERVHTNCQLAPIETHAPASTIPGTVPHRVAYAQLPGHTPHIPAAVTQSPQLVFAESHTQVEMYHPASQNTLANWPTVQTTWTGAPNVVSPDKATNYSTPSFAEAPSQPVDVKSEDPEQPQEPLPIISPSMEPLNLQEIDNDEEPMSEMELAMKSLVNLNDINEVREPPEQIKLREKKQANQSKRSKPIPPAVPQWHLGGQPSLSAIKDHKTQKAPRQDIMKVHAFDPAAAQAGMMVVYGHTPPPQQGHDMTFAAGFSAGAQPSHYGHQRVC